MTHTELEFRHDTSENLHPNHKNSHQSRYRRHNDNRKHWFWLNTHGQREHCLGTKNSAFQKVVQGIELGPQERQVPTLRTIAAEMAFALEVAVETAFAFGVAVACMVAFAPEIAFASETFALEAAAFALASEFAIGVAFALKTQIVQSALYYYHCYYYCYYYHSFHFGLDKEPSPKYSIVQEQETRLDQ